MKIQISITSFLILSFISSFAQVEQTIVLDPNLKGKQYRITTYIHTPDSTSFGFFPFQFGDNNKYLKDKSRKRDSEYLNEGWKKTTLTGKIQKKTERIKINLFTSSSINEVNIDNIRFEIENNGIWENVELINQDFSLVSEKSDTIPGWKVYPGYSYKVDTVTYFSGKQSLQFKTLDLQKYGRFGEHGQRTQVNNIEIYYEIYGQGEPLLLLHGNNQSISSFRYQIDEFRKYYQVIAVDSRGQGESTIDDQKMTYSLMAEDMFILLDSLNLDSVNIVGWSDGGNTGLIMAMNYPSKVKTLTIMGANLYLKKGVVEKKYLRNYRWEIRLVNVVSIFNPKEWKTPLRIAKMPLKYPQINVSDLAFINIPVLVMAGENDIIMESHTQLIANGITNSKIDILKQASHFAPVKKSDYFNKEVLQFLSNYNSIIVK